MLSKKRRIPRELFPRILKEGKRYSSPSLLLYVASRGNNEPSRFSFSISKKVCKKATDRNKHRRRGYSVIEKYLPNVKPGFFCFFSFKKGSSGVSFSALEKEVFDLLKVSSVVI
jgi:ribonuclease P protein component